MSKSAAIMGSLVDARNVGTHKSVKLTIHVPAEQAMLVFEAFGWPTMADPVAVAVARLDPDKAVKPRTKVSSDKRLARQAGMCCADPIFRRFLVEEDLIPESSEEFAALVVRSYCGVASRADILPDTIAAEKWDALYGKFLAWKNAA